MAVLITGFCPAHGAGTVDFSFGETAVCTPRPGIYILLSAKPAQDPQLSFNGPVSLPPVISPRSFQLNHSPTVRAACKNRQGTAFLQAACLYRESQTNRCFHHSAALKL